MPRQKCGRQSNKSDSHATFLEILDDPIAGPWIIILPLRCKLAGLWWSFSLMVICGYVEQQQQWPLLVITANFAGSTFAVMAVFKTRK